MSKILVETTGSFQFLDPSTGKLIRHEGYTVADQGGIVSERVANGQIRLIAEVNDEATDEDWLDTVKQSDGDLELALEAFKSEFPADGPRVKKAGGFKSKHKETVAEKAAREAAEKAAADQAAADADADADAQK